MANHWLYIFGELRKKNGMDQPRHNLSICDNAMHSSLKLLDGCNGMINLKADWTIYYAYNVIFLSGNYNKILYN